jgi:uncharacterized protein YegL
MRSLLDVMTPPKSKLPLFFLIETSGGMHGRNISAINAAMEELVSYLREKQSDYPMLRMKIAVLEFSTGAKWHSMLVDVELFGKCLGVA